VEAKVQLNAGLLHVAGPLRSWLILEVGRNQMFSQLRMLFRKKAALDEFTGVGVVLISDQCAARLLGEPIGPVELIEVMKEVLSIQTEVAERFGASIDKYVGGGVVAYWPPRAMPGAVSSACSAAIALMTTKTVGRVQFSMRVSFCAADFAVAGFGPVGRQRIQAVGKAYDRANAMQAKIPAGGIVTDEGTFQMLPASERVKFVSRDGFVFRA
jgi:class 3 adenylate cyclase